MKQIGLRTEILFNTLFLTAVGMILLGFVAFVITGRSALRGEVEGIKSIITAFSSLYFRYESPAEGIHFLKDALGPGSWGVIVDRQKGRFAFQSDDNKKVENQGDPLILDVMKTGETVVEVEGINFPPFSNYKGFKIATPLIGYGRQTGAILLYKPIQSVSKEISAGDRIIAISILLNLIAIAIYGHYILSRRVIRPVQQLINTTDHISRGDFPSDLDLGGVKEINQLQNALKNMYDEIEVSKKSLKDNIQALEGSNLELLKTQKELIASEKFASIGRFGAGIAHEIGNPLSAIRGYVEVLNRGYFSDEEKREEYLECIQNEVDRIDRIIRTLIDYSKPRDFELREVDVNNVINQAVDIVRSQGLLKMIDLRLGLSENPLITKADQHQLCQVMINLFLNSRDAINGDGIIEINTANHDGIIEVDFRDNGCGIPEELIDKIFDPFFTTKDPGKGTGLGLSISERILQRFGAKISAESKLGHGSNFKITLPYLRGHLRD